MNFQSIGAQGNYAAAGKAVADESVRIFAATRKNSPNFGKMAQQAADIRSKEKQAMTQIASEVTSRAISNKASVRNERTITEAKDNLRKSTRKAGVLATGGKFFANAGTYLGGEKEKRRTVGENDSWYDQQAKKTVDQTSKYVDMLNSQEDPAPVELETYKAPPTNEGGTATNSGSTGSTGNGGASASTEFKGIVDMATKAGAKHPQLVAAQWALESAHGTTPSGKNNFFGLKSTSGGTSKATWEVIDGKEVNTTANFMDFDSPQDSVNHLVSRWHQDYKGYEGVNNSGDAFSAADSLLSQGYATDPKYAQKLKDIMRQNGY